MSRMQPPRNQGVVQGGRQAEPQEAPSSFHA
jgi:hypothetical protein